MSVEGLGTWPTLALSDAIPADLAPLTFDSSADFVSGALVVTDDVFIAGYTGAGAAGTLAVHQRGAGTNTFLDAPGNFSFTSFRDDAIDRVLINGLGLGAVGDGVSAGLFGLDDTATPEPLLALDLGAGNASSAVVVAGDRVFVARFNLTTFANDFYALSGAAVAGAFDDPAAPAVIPETPFVSLPVILGAAALGGDLVVVEGDANFRPARLALIPTVDTAGVLSAGEAQTILSFDECTSPTFVTQLGDDVLVGLDRFGSQTILQLRRAAP